MYLIVMAIAWCDMAVSVCSTAILVNRLESRALAQKSVAR